MRDEIGTLSAGFTDKHSKHVLGAPNLEGRRDLELHQKITPCRRSIQQNLVAGHSLDQIFATCPKKLQFSQDGQFKIQTRIRYECTQRKEVLHCASMKNNNSRMSQD